MSGVLRRFKEEQRIQKQIAGMSPYERASFEAFKAEQGERKLGEIEERFDDRGIKLKGMFARREAKERASLKSRRQKAFTSEARRVRAGIIAQPAAIQAAAVEQQNFSQEQEVIGELFGGGDKIWGTEMNPVTLHHDLNPRQRGETETADMFGLGY